MGSKGDTSAPPTIMPQQNSGMDPMMMQMMMAMMSRNNQQQQMPQVPQISAPPVIEQPEGTTAAPVDWQAKMQEYRDLAEASYSKDDDQRLVNAFIPAEDEEESSLLTEETDA